MDPGYALALGGSFAVGIWLIIRTAERFMAGASIPKHFGRWHDELEHRALRAIQADMHAAECRAALVELIGQIPQDFDPTALLACQVAAGVHRAVLDHAERQGLVRPGSFEKVYGPRLDGERIPAFDREPEPEPEPELDLSPRLERPKRELVTVELEDLEELEERARGTRGVPRARWVNGRLVVR